MTSPRVVRLEVVVHLQQQVLVSQVDAQTKKTVHILLRKFHNLITWEAWDHGASREPGGTQRRRGKAMRPQDHHSLYQALSASLRGPGPCKTQREPRIDPKQGI